MAVFLNEKGILKNKICDKSSLPESDKIPSRHAEACRGQETPPCFLQEASFTLEAAVILPLMALFFVMILMFFRVMQVQLDVQKALDDTGRSLAVWAAEEAENHATAVDIAAAKVYFGKNIRKSNNINRYVTNKAAGISLSKSKFKGDTISLTASYSIKMPIALPGKSKIKIKIKQHAVCRKWVGWTDHSDDTEVWVYVAENGSVYHTSRECTHIKLSVTSANYSAISKKRNAYGEKYHECEYCAGKRKNKDVVFITDQGNRFHYDLNCSGIKRTIYMIRLSEIGNRKKCSRCKT